MSATLLRPRSVVEIIDAAFRLCRAHYPVLVTTTAVVLLPAIVLRLVLPEGAASVADLLQNLLLPLANAAIIAVVSDGYLGHDVRAGAGLRAIRGRVGSLLAASIISGVLVIIGIVLLIIPGLIAVAWTFAMPMAIVIEGHRVAGAFQRSRELARGHVLRVLGTLALAFLLFIVVVVVLAILVEVARSALGLSDRVGGVATDLSLVLVYPLVGVAATLLYYDLRIRKEGYDLAVMARELGEPFGAPPSGAFPSDAGVTGPRG